MEALENVVITAKVTTNKTTNEFSGSLGYYEDVESLLSDLLEFLYSTTGDRFFISRDENDDN